MKSCTLLGSKGKSWYSPKLHAMKDKLMLLQDMCKKNLCDNKLVKDYQVSYRKEIQAEKQKANEMFINKADNKCRAAWSIINSIAQKGENKNKNCGDLHPNVLNDYFTKSIGKIISSIPTSLEEALNSLHQSNLRVNVNFTLSEVSCEQVFEAICKLNDTKSKDYYEVSANLVKSVANSIVMP